MTTAPLFRGATAVVLVVVVAWKYDLREAVQRVDPSRAYWVAASVLVLGLSQVIGAERWHLLLRQLQVVVPFARTLRAYFAGLFGGLFLPTTIGGDAVRSWILIRERGAGASVVAATLLDRISGLLALVAIAWIAIAFGAASVVGGWAISAVGGATVAFGVGVLFLVVIDGALRRRGFQRRFLIRLTDVAGFVRDGARDRTTTILVCLAALSVQTLFALHAFLLAEFLQLGVSFSVLALVTPLVVVLTLVPISLGGFGIREASLVVLLEPAGVDAGDATLLGLLMGASLVVVALPGATVLLPGRRPTTPGHS